MNVDSSGARAATRAGSDARRRAYQDAAEVRLGRQLTPAERHVDIHALDVALRNGKFRLAAAIDAEKGRAIRASLDGKATWRPQITPAMMDVLTGLHELGIETGLRELRSMGYLVERSFASPDTDELEAARKKVTQALRDGMPKRRIGALRKAFDALLQSLGLRIRRTTRKLKPVLTVKLDTLARRKIEREAEKRVPGSMDIAGRLVSGALYAGLGATFEEHQDLIPCWEYSAIMDNATCAPCRDSDGRRFNTWKAAMRVLPGGGPNPLCRGDGRCRCRLVPCLPGTDPDTGAVPLVEHRTNDFFRPIKLMEQLALTEKLDTPVLQPEPAMVRRIVEVQNRLDRVVKVRLPTKLEPFPLGELLPKPDDAVGGTTHGVFGRGGEGEPLFLGVSSEQLEGSMEHEFGHLLDSILQNGDGTFDTRYGSARQNLIRTEAGATLAPSPHDAAYAKLLDAIEDTEPIRRLRAMKEAALSGEIGEWRKVDAQGRELTPDVTYINYLLRPHEMFARAFAAFVAEETDDFPRQIHQDVYATPQAYYPQTFSYLDRDRVAEAFREFFREVGFAP